MKHDEPILLKTQPKIGVDVHYFWVPQPMPILTVCGVDCSAFECTNAAVNCPDCRDKIDGYIDSAREARELVAT